MEELKFRKAKLNDMLDVFLIESEYFPDNVSLGRWLIEFLYDPRFSFVCTYRRRVVGFIRAEEIEEQEVMIHTLCVIEEFSTRGIGMRLVELCLKSVRKTSRYTGIRLMVSLKNTAAKSLYEKLGFKIIMKEEKVYFDGSDGFIMELEL